MSDPVIAACIVASATMFSALMQLRAAYLREAAARAQQSSGQKRKPRPPVLLWIALGLAAGAGGFALSQWLADRELKAHEVLEGELRAHIRELSLTASRLQESRIGTRAEIEADVLRRIGEKGVIVTATVPPCRPAPLIGEAPAPDASTQADSPPSAGSPGACTEADVSPITLCAAIPAAAQVTDVELYVRHADADTPWKASRVTADQEMGQARFVGPPSETLVTSDTKQLCQSFAHWATDQARVARMVVRYSIQS